MRTVNPNTRHYVTNPRIAFGRVVAYGMSVWDMPDGSRCRREMSRSSVFNSVKEMTRWAKRYNVNIERELAEWKALENSLPAPVA